MLSNKLTENNLKDLDEKIQKEKELIDKRAVNKTQNEAPKPYDAKSQTSKKSRTASQQNMKLDDLKSQHSRQSRKSVADGYHKPAVDQLSSKTKEESEEVVLDEEDEWAAIQKFNAILHYEEQKQAAFRVAERKRLLR